MFCVKRERRKTKNILYNAIERTNALNYMGVALFWVVGGLK